MGRAEIRKSSRGVLAAVSSVVFCLVYGLAAAAGVVFLASCTATGEDSFAKAPGVDEVWLVNAKGAFDKRRASAKAGVVRVTVENRTEAPARVSVIDSSTKKMVADFPVGIRQVNWEEVTLASGSYEIVAQRIGDGAASRSVLDVS